MISQPLDFLQEVSHARGDPRLFSAPPGPSNAHPSTRIHLGPLFKLFLVVIKVLVKSGPIEIWLFILVLKVLVNLQTRWYRGVHPPPTGAIGCELASGWRGMVGDGSRAEAYQGGLVVIFCEMGNPPKKESITRESKTVFHDGARRKDPSRGLLPLLQPRPDEGLLRPAAAMRLEHRG